MGGSTSKINTRCESRSQRPPDMGSTNDQFDQIPMEPPPRLQMPMSFEQKLYDKFTKQPLVPLGCMMTAYFLMSGIKSFKDRDPRRAQKMMRARVGAQFATLLAFVSYVGLDNVNFEIAPAYYRKKEAEEAYKKHMAAVEGGRQSGGGASSGSEP